MEQALDIAESVLMAVLNFAFFVVLSVIFLPSFLIVTYLQKPWEDAMKKNLGI